ncbi:MAG: hypothetical protein LBK72_08085, partial [Bifidobacteriaceae bacterium]|nr:hypothetical protein [Bifidobacteriaceae bacterium]
MVRYDVLMPYRGAKLTNPKWWTIIPVVLAFIAAHVACLVAIYVTDQRTSLDIGVYVAWVEGALNQGEWPVIDFEWVYPFVALVPMLCARGLAAVSGLSFLNAWWILVSGVNLATAARVIRVFGWRRAQCPLLVWAVFIGLMGGTSLFRLDAFVVTAVVWALLEASRRPGVAA